MQAAAADKRVFHRVPVTLTAHCRLGNRFLREAVGNLSIGGLYLRTRERAREGTPIRVALALPHGDGPRICTLAGTVVRVDRDEHGLSNGLGVRFEEKEISELDRQTLRRFVTLQGGSVAVTFGR